MLNAGPYDANLIQYAARNVLLPGDRVIVVRCFSKNLLQRQNRENLEQEKGSTREIGRNKLMGSDVAMSVEILSVSEKMQQLNCISSLRLRRISGINILSIVFDMDGVLEVLQKEYL